MLRAILHHHLSELVVHILLNALGCFFLLRCFFADDLGLAVELGSGRALRAPISPGLFGEVRVSRWQALALVPGTSRSGITMTAGLMLGLTREAAARFAFLLSVPGIALAGGYEGFKFATGVAGESVPVAEMLLGLVVSAVVGYFCIHYFLRFIARIGFLPFTVYRLLLAGFIVLVFA